MDEVAKVAEAVLLVAVEFKLVRRRLSDAMRCTMFLLYLAAATTM